MKGKILKRVVAAALALLIVSGGVPMQPVADVFGDAVVTASADSVLSGEGTEQKPYLIESVDDWAAFASNINDGINSSAYYKLGDSWDNSENAVTAAVGTQSSPFTGTFDGNGKTLHVNISDTSTQGTAPFREISGGAVIKNINVEGTVVGTTHAAGLVGFSRDGDSDSPNTIENCTVNTDVSVPGTSGNRHMGGVVGHGVTSYLVIKDTVFGGAMTNTGNFAGGLQGWSDGNTLTIENCLFKGSYSGEGSFHPIAIHNSNSNTSATINGAYYTTEPAMNNNTSFIAAEGTQVYTSAPALVNTEMITAADGETYYIVTGYQSVTEINSADDWDSFSETVNSGNTYEGVTVKLNADISVSTMVGTSDNKFKGTFDGQGHTIHLDLTSTDEYCAPFRYVDGASICCLNTDGTVSADTYKYGSGLIGDSRGMVNIKNCRSSVSIESDVEGDGTHGGFVGVAGSGTLNITNCLFDGTVSGSSTTNCGGFVGWRNCELNITNCLMNGTLDISVDSNSATFSRGGGVFPLANSYYKNSYGTVQGTAVGLMTNEQLAAKLGSAWKVSDDNVLPIMDASNFVTTEVSGVDASYNATGSTISITPTLTAINGTVLTENTDYTVTLTKDGESASIVKDPGNYTYTFTAKDGSGYSGSASVSFKVVFSAPTSLKQTAYTDTTAALSWDQSGDVSSWIVEYTADSSFENAKTVTANTTSVTLTDLSEEAKYYVRVKAVSGDIESDYSGTATVYTTSKLWLGVGSENTYYQLPTQCNFNYSVTQQIYTSSELGIGERAVTSVDFMNAGNYDRTRNIDIYMVHTNKSEFSSAADWISVTEADKVFSGSVTFAKNAWSTITFDNSFIYNGADNVALIVDDNTGSFGGSTPFLAYSGNFKKSIFKYSDSTNYDPISGITDSDNGSYAFYNNAVRFGTADVCTINVDDNIANGSITVSREKAAEGDTITVTTSADNGYYCSSVTASLLNVERNIDDTFSFVMQDIGHDITVSAEFAEIHNVTVNWKNFDGTILKTDSVLVGSTPTYSGDEPTRPNDDFYSYTFTGWDIVGGKVYDDTNITAVYKSSPLKLTDTLTVCDGESMAYFYPIAGCENNRATGSEEIYPADMLTGLKGRKLWNMTFYAQDDAELRINGMKVYLAEVDFTAFPDGWVEPPKNAVKVFDGDYNFKQGENVIDFETPFEYGGKNLMVLIQNTTPESEAVDMCFYGTYTGITDISRYRYTEYNWTYSSTFLPKCTFGFVDDNYYTVTWKGEDGAVLEKDNNLIYGATPEFNGTLPSDTEDDFYTITYKWDKEITAVTGDTTYTIKAVKTPKNPLSLTVCDSTNSDIYVPYKCDQNKSTTGSDQIYPASQLTALKDKMLWSMTFYAKEDYTIDVKGMKVYLAEVDFTTLDDKFPKAENGVVNLYDITDSQIGSTFTATNFKAVKVFDGDYDFKQGENLINFDTPYNYGGGNLLVMIENTAPGTTSGNMNFYAKYIGSYVSRIRYNIYNYSYGGRYLAKCTFGYVDENKYTVTWKDADGNTLETDENVISGTAPSFDSISKLTIPEGSTLFWLDGTNTYEANELPAVTGDVTYKAVVVRYYSKDSEGIDDGVILKDIGDTIDTKNTSQKLTFDCDVSCDYYNDGSNLFDIDSGWTWSDVDSFYINDNNEFICYNEGCTSRFTPLNGTDFKVSYNADEDMWHIADIFDTSKTYTVTWTNEDGTTVLETDENVPAGTQALFDSMDKLTIPEGKTLFWSDGTNTYEANELPAVTGDVTYKAVVVRCYSKDSEGIDDGVILKDIGDTIDTKNTSQNLKFDCDVYCDYYNDGSDLFDIDSGGTWRGVDFFYINDNNEFICYNFGLRSKFTPVNGTDFKVSYNADEDMWHIADALDTSKTYTVTWTNEDGTTVLETDENVPAGTQASFDSMDKLTIPEGSTLFWSDGNKLYRYDELPAVVRDVTYKAVVVRYYNKDSEGIADGVILKYIGDTIDTKNTSKYLKFDCDVSCDYTNDGALGNIESGETLTEVESFYINDNNELICYNYGHTSKFTPVNGIGFKVSYDADEDIWHIADVFDTSKTYTVTWTNEDGTTVLETDENVPAGTQASFDSMDKLTIPEGSTLFWSDGNKLYRYDDLPLVAHDVTYTAEIKNVKNLAVGTVFSLDDMVYFGKGKFFNDWDENGEIELWSGIGLAEFGEPEYDSVDGLYWIVDQNSSYGFGVTSEKFDTSFSVMCVAGDGTKNKPFLFKTIPESGENSFKIVCESNGKFVYDIYAASGDTISAPDEPYNAPGDNYSFVCWLGEDGRPFDFETPITSDTMLTALWRDNSVTHTVTLMSDDGSTVLYTDQLVPDKYIYGEAKNTESYTNKSESFEFLGWYTIDGKKFDFSKPIDSDVVVFEKWKAENGIGERLAGHSLSLNGNIGVNFYMELDSTVAANPNAYMRFTLPNGTTQDVTVAKAAKKTISGKMYYVFQCETAAKEMTDTITAQMFSGDKSGEVYRYTVKEYADYLFENAYNEDGTVKNESYAEAYSLIESMVNYGAYSQTYFNHNTENLANADIENTDVSAVTADTINMPYDSSTENLPEGVTFAGVSLVLESETVMNLYFTNTTGKALTFTTRDNVTLTQEQSGKYTKVTITDIAAQDLDEYVKVNVAVEGNDTEYSVYYSPMNYCYNTLSRETTETRTDALKDVMRALYLYNQEAKAYFDANIK